ncbi:MAG: FtsX-like permease family protein [Propionivibrio sp.]|uniref:FtsX-like permease family protein n=1 Tax=Propionivibrio sp. TaxID=2212460 RepID=UPI0025CF0EF8|nr:FtsX-like permease family protein [Propionivibrio sp.]MBK8895583.1 FtsX-like permease family protein [Propionivibrio sp.]
MRLAPVFLGSLSRRRLSTLFSLVAVILGVALGMAVQAVHEAALNEFGRGLRALAGDADLQVIGPRGGFDENLYALLAARPEVAFASPVVEVQAKIAGREESLQLLGLDIFSLARVTPALLPQSMGSAATERLATLSEDTLFLSTSAQTALGTKADDPLRLQAGTHILNLRVAGDLPGVAENQRIAVMDIAVVQDRFGLLGRLTRIDLRLNSKVSPDAARASLQPLLPAGVLIETPRAAETQAANLSRAYRVNLTLLAAMALLTGGFLVFSAQALSVVRRRTEFAFLRAIGLDRRTLFSWLLAEGAVVGLAGGLVGVALGHGLAWVMLSFLGGDLGAGYFAGLQPQLLFQPAAMVTYLALGVLAGVAGAWLPAREAATVSPAQALKTGGDSALPGGRGYPGAGTALLAASLAACWIPPLRGLPVGGYVAVLFLLAGSVMILPAVAAGITRQLPNCGSVPFRLAAARLEASPGHAVVAAAGVLTSVALAAAMSIMVASFRDSVDQWLHQLLPADLYLRTGTAQTGGFLDEALQGRISAVSGISRVNFTRHGNVRLAAGRAPVALIARPLSPDGRELPVVGARRSGDSGVDPAVWISEAVQDIYGWRPGQRVELPLAGRRVRLQVAGVWRDYARQTGALMIDLADYRRLSGDRLANEAAIWLAPGAAPAQVAAALTATGRPGTLAIAYPGEIRAISLRIFDRTFAVTYLLEAVAVIIGLAGVAASFAALAVARRREFGMLRHLGLTRRQIGWMLAQEGALSAGMGVLGGLLAGTAIGLVLIEVVNRQSFHWSMDLHIPWGSLTLFAGALIALAALAAVLAGRQAMRQEAIFAVREDW